MIFLPTTSLPFLFPFLPSSRVCVAPVLGLFSLFPSFLSIFCSRPSYRYTLLHKCSLVLVALASLFFLQASNASPSTRPPVSQPPRVNMPLALSPVPEISISLASPEEPVPEPFSPFAQCSFLTDNQDSFRPALLSPPPSSMVSPRQLSPLRPKDVPVTGKGLERERFEALLQASRDRNAAIGSKKHTDLRKEIALKVHRSKQGESPPRS